MMCDCLPGTIFQGRGGEIEGLRLEVQMPMSERERLILQKMRG